MVKKKYIQNYFFKGRKLKLNQARALKIVFIRY